jgi:hypothetical protein
VLKITQFTFHIGGGLAMSEEDDRLESVTKGEKLQLKEGRLPHVKIREWEFIAIEKGKAI